MSRRARALPLVATLIVQSAGVVACEVGEASGPHLPPGTRTGWYVRTTGTSAGTGADSLAWDLGTALSGAHGVIQPGDTVWIRGGTYRGSYTGSLTGTAGSPVVVRAYPGERAILDGNGSTQSTFVADGAWTVYWGLEIINSMTARSGSGLGLRPGGVYVRNASDVKLINFIVHETGHGVYTEPAASNIELYGWIVYNGGHQNPTRADGHGMYVKNNATAGKKVFRDNVIFNMFAFGVHGYTEGPGRLENMVFTGNVAFNNGQLSDDHTPNFQLGGTRLADNDTIRDNLLYFSAGLPTDYNFRIGYGAQVNDRTVLADNYAVRGNPVIEVGYWTALEVVDNTFVGDAMMTRLFDPSTTGQTWSGNTHYRTPTASAWRYTGTNYSFATWQALTGLGMTDQALAGTPATPFVFVRPHQYQAGAALVAIVNWPKQAAVAVDLSGALPSGQRYEVRNVQALFGAPVVSGTYEGGSVSFPMSGVTPPAPIGGSPNPPVRTAPEFDVFVVRPVSP